jgi:drug/metabolite transporter (DMT)-like permease
MRATTQHTKAILLAVFVTILWSTSWILIKEGLHDNLPGSAGGGWDTGCATKTAREHVK